MVQWTEERAAAGSRVSGYRGTIAEHPQIVLQVTLRGWWEVRVSGALAHSGMVEDHQTKRAQSRMGRHVTPVWLARKRAEDWAERVVAKLQAIPGYAPEARTPGDTARAPVEGEAGPREGGEGQSAAGTPTAAPEIPGTRDGSRDLAMLGLHYLDDGVIVSCGDCAERLGIVWKYDSTEADLSADVCAHCGAAWSDPEAPA